MRHLSGEMGDVEWHYPAKARNIDRSTGTEAGVMQTYRRGPCAPAALAVSRLLERRVGRVHRKVGEAALATGGSCSGARAYGDGASVHATVNS